MRPDFGVLEFLLIMILALVVVGPKDLPRLMRSLGQIVGRVRMMAADFQGVMNAAAAEADILDAQVRTLDADARDAGRKPKARDDAPSSNVDPS